MKKFMTSACMFVFVIAATVLAQETGMESGSCQRVRSSVFGQNYRWLHECYLQARSEGRTTTVKRHPCDGEHR